MNWHMVNFEKKRGSVSNFPFPYEKLAETVKKRFLTLTFLGVVGTVICFSMKLKGSTIFGFFDVLKKVRAERFKKPQCASLDFFAH